MINNKLLLTLLLGPIAVSCGEKTSKFTDSAKAPVKKEALIQEAKTGNLTPKVRTPDIAAPVTLSQDSVVVPQKPSDKVIIELLSAETYSQNGTNIIAKWKLTEAFTGLELFTLRVFDKLDNLVYEKEGNAASFLQGDHYEFALPETLSAGAYSLNISGYGNNTELISARMGKIIVDATPPTATLYLGSELSVDPCNAPFGARQFVSTRVASYDFCAQDDNAGVALACIKKESQLVNNQAPAATDNCWQHPLSFSRLVVLSSENAGLNKYVLFIKDKAGNIGRDQKNITLSPSLPPRIDILNPNSSEIASAVWNVGEKKTVKWKITDLDTDYSQIKIVVSLINPSNQSEFKHLACNFANTSVFKQCPEASLENSSLITATGNDQGEISFTIPANWGSDKKYIVAVTAIDKAGNAAVASTGEVNAGWEVLAGRTYAGAGGSGVTINRTGYAGIIRADYKGQLYDLRQNLKLRAFDNRSCRMIRGTSEQPQPFDCEDIIVTNLNISFLLNNFWEYNVNKDVFYSKYSENRIVEIDFNKGSIKDIFNSTSPKATKVLSKSIAAGEFAKDYKATEVLPTLSYEPIHKNLFFIADDRMYRITESGELRYVLGDSRVSIADEQLNVAQSALILPNAGKFKVTSDNRIIFSGAKTLSWSAGAGFATQHLIRDFSLTNSNLQTSMETLSTNLTATSPGVAALGGQMYDITYDPSTQTLISALAWWGYYKMVLPAKSATKEAYTWGKAIDHIGHSYSMTYIPNTQVTYWIDSLLGRIYSTDLVSKERDRLVGFETGSEANQLGQNRYLDTPLHLSVINDNELYFNDFFNLQKLTLNATNAAWDVQTVANSFPMFKFKVENNLLFQVRKELKDPNDSSKGTVPSLFVAPLNNLSTSSSANLSQLSSAYAGYDLAQGLGNNLSTTPKMVYITSAWNGQSVYASRMFSSKNVLTSNNQITISNSYLHSTIHSLKDKKTDGSSYCAPAESCEQTSQTANYYLANNYRLAQVSGSYGWRSSNTAMAFSSDDNGIFGCINNQFSFTDITDSANAKHYFYTATVAGSPLTCVHQGSQFAFINGNLYFAYNDGFYKLVTNNIMTSNTAVFEKVQTESPVLTGLYGGFHITNDYIYYSHRGSHRIIRNKIKKP